MKDKQVLVMKKLDKILKIIGDHQILFLMRMKQTMKSALIKMMFKKAHGQ